MKTPIKSSIALTLLVALTTSGCASIISPDSATRQSQVNLKKSFLAEEHKAPKEDEVAAQSGDEQSGEFKRLNRLSDSQKPIKLEVDLSKRFGSEKRYQVSVNALPLNDFIHYTLGELLQVSYLVEPSVKNKTTPVTLELKEKVSAQHLFQLVQEVLTQNQVNINLNEEVFYLTPETKKGSKTDTAFGFGRTAASVPNVAADIMQLVPVKYGASSGLRSAVSGLVDAKVSIDMAQGMFTIKGKREQVLRALSLINLLDSPALNNKAVALMRFNYIDSQTFIDKAKELLAMEGISAESSRTASSSVRFIPIEHLGQVVVFATADEIIDRVEYWKNELDKPATGSEQSFYIYHPKYARASDLGQSLAPLLGGSFNSTKKTTRNVTGQSTPSSQQGQGQAQTQRSNQPTTQTIEGDGIRLVVDERANALIFYSTGQYYQELQPILRQLDIMPKQVMMEVVIAEVSLTGSFAKGVQYAIQSGAAGSKSETFSFNSDEGFNYSIVGLPGNLNVNLSQTDGLVNVLSRPTLLVRDGVAANISVGDDIPTIGSTTADPDGQRQTTNVQYRKTGVDLTVTPTINAQGTVIMTIEQQISSVNPDSAGAGDNPAIFERTLNTEVVAGDGQTVMLGGLISENNTSGASSVPGLGSIPVLGHLFRTDSSSRDKTELVVLVTPKIVHSLDDWQRVKESFIKGLENLKF